MRKIGCERLQNNEASGLCQLLRHSSGRKLRGDVPAVYAQAIKRLESEEDRFAHGNGRVPRPFTDLVSVQNSFRLPWLFNDFDPQTREDDRALLNLKKQLDQIKSEIPHPSGNTLTFERDYLRRIVTWMEQRVQKRNYVPYESDNLALLNGAPGDCTELSRFAYAVLRLAGFQPQFLRVTQHALDSSITYHICVGVALDPQRPEHLTQIDLYHRGFLGKAHPGTERISATAMLAVYENTQAFHLNGLLEGLLNYSRHDDGILNGLAALGSCVVAGLMEMHYRQALAYAPKFADSYFNLARLYHVMGAKSSAARRLNKAALELRPHFTAAQLLAHQL